MHHSPLEDFIHASLPPMNAHRAGSLDKARQLLESEPALTRESVVAATLAGDLEQVKEAVKTNPGIGRQTFAPHDWPLLLYLCFSLFYRDDPSRREAFHGIAQVLLDDGADAAAYFMLGDEKETALYGATGVANDAVLGGMLLDAGADVNDEDASYHIAEHDTCEAIELLFSRGMRADLQVTTLLHKLDYDDLVGVRTILDLGADPNGRGRWGKTALHQAIMRGRSLSFLELLIERGADVSACRDDGKSALALASRVGRQDIVDLLVAHGADTAMTPADQFLSACACGDKERARAVLAKHNGLVASMDDEDHLALIESARDGKTEAVRMMLDAGMDVAARGACGGTALHWAAWHGHADAVSMLLAAGAPVDRLCTSYQNSPLGWGVYGSTACKDPQGDYVGVTKGLLASGAAIEAYMYEDGTPELVRLLHDEASRRSSRER